MSSYTLYHGDCLDILPTLEPQSVDAVIADIPSGRTACAWDSVIPFDAMWANLKRVAKRHAAIVLLGCTQPFTSALVMSNVKWFRYVWVWDKGHGKSFQLANIQPMRAHEDVLVFGDSGTIYNPQMEPLEKPYSTEKWGQRSVGKTTNSYLGSKQVTKRVYTHRYPKTILSFNSQAAECNNAHKLHPTQKPLALLEYLVRTYTNEYDVVLDFTMGSGTTGHACGNLGRRFIGIEKDEHYFNVASERIATAYEPLRHMQVAS